MEVGLTVTEVPANPPGFQLYEVAPEPVNVAISPLQIEAGELLAFTGGNGTTVTTTLSWLVQPAPLEPISVYVVVPEGETTRLAALDPPGSQVNEEAEPDAVKVTLSPTHMDEEEAEAMTVGGVLTVT